MATMAELQRAYNNPNVRKMLDVIASSEGVKHGYNTLFGNQQFDNLSAHPNVRKQFTQTDGKTNYTTAAGRYQFIKGTWGGLQKQYGFKDFSPQSQDLGAIALIAQRGALDDVMMGRFQQAIGKLGSEWASLPSSRYAQPKRSWDNINKMLGSSGGNSGGFMYFGDSIANGYRQQSKGLGTTQNGASSSAVYKQLQQALSKNPNALRGKNIVLSSGYSNSVDDTNSINQQLALLKKAGANVQLLGVANQYNKFGQNGSAMNSNLQNIAKQHGVSFLGGFDAGNDLVHPKSYDDNYSGRLNPSISPRQEARQPAMKWADLVGQNSQGNRPEALNWSDLVGQSNKQNTQPELNLSLATDQQVQNTQEARPQAGKWADLVGGS